MARFTDVRLPVPRDILALAGVAFSVALGFGIVTPAIPLFSKSFGVGTTAAGAVVSAFALMRLVFGPFGGKLVDRLGERTTLVAGLAVVAVSSLLAGLAQNYPQLLVLRAIGGIGSTAFTVAATALVIRVALPEARGRSMSIYQSGFLIGGIVGPAAGGAVLGLSVRAPFFLYAGTLGLAVIVGLLFLTDPKNGQPDPSSADAAADPAEPEQPMRLSEALRQPGYRAALSANFAVGLSLFGIRSAIVPVLLESIHAPRQWIGWSFFVGSVAQAALMWPAGRFVDTAGRRMALFGGGLVTAFGMGMMAFGRDLWFIVLAMAVFGAGGAFLGSAPGALIGDVVRGRSGIVVAAFQMSGDVGAVIGPVVAGFLVDKGSFEGAFGVGAVVLAVAALIGLQAPAKPPPIDDNRP